MTIYGFPVRKIDGEYAVILAGNNVVIEASLSELRRAVDAELTRYGMQEDAD